MQTTIHFLCNASKRMYVREQGITDCMTVSETKASIVLKGDWLHFARAENWGHLIYAVRLQKM